MLAFPPPCFLRWPSLFRLNALLTTPALAAHLLPFAVPVRALAAAGRVPARVGVACLRPRLLCWGSTGGVFSSLPNGKTGKEGQPNTVTR